MNQLFKIHYILTGWQKGLEVTLKTQKKIAAIPLIMPNEHFCLKWNNFQRNIVAALGNLKLDEDFVDVTISCEGKLIKAHKVILSACSDYFRDLFRVSIF